LAAVENRADVPASSATACVPAWFTHAAVCPEDRAQLSIDIGAIRCTRCERSYAVRDGVVSLLPDRLRHLAEVQPRVGDANAPEDVRWIEEELRWWDPVWAKESVQPHSPRSGLRGRSRERQLFRHVRGRVRPSPLVLELGAGSSRTVAGLWPPASADVRYCATDVSLSALRAGRRILGRGYASVQCDAVEWPFAEGVADVVIVLGVLHHLVDWRRALERACRTVRPGGFLLLHEAVTKPRILATRRPGGLDDSWTSPHEGDVPAEALRAELQRYGRVVRWRGEESPMRFGLVRLLIHPHRYDVLENSRPLTMLFNAADQALGRALGHVVPSLGFNEVTAVWQP
jgi:SAM-dependent methyltransferase